MSSPAAPLAAMLLALSAVSSAPSALPAPAPPRLAFGSVRAPVGQGGLAGLATGELRRELARAVGIDVVPLPGDGGGDSLALARSASVRIHQGLEAARALGADYLCLAGIVSARSLLLAPAIGRPAAENEAVATLLLLRVRDGCAILDLTATRKRSSHADEASRGRGLAEAVVRAARELGCQARQTVAVSGQVYAMAGRSEAILLLDARDGLRKGTRLQVVRPPSPAGGSGAAARADLEVGEVSVTRIEPARCFARLHGGVQAHAGDRVYAIPDRSCTR